jgi:hypothetical protein
MLLHQKRRPPAFQNMTNQYGPGSGVERDTSE